jgi:hypothetical protein
MDGYFIFNYCIPKMIVTVGLLLRQASHNFACKPGIFMMDFYADLLFFLICISGSCVAFI